MLRSVLLLAGLLSLALSGTVHAQGRPATGDGDQEKRLQRLEEQIVDLNAQIGTMESMTRGAGGGGGGGPVSGGGGSGGGDIGQMESQVRAMSGQMNDLLRRLERIEARFGAASPSNGDSAPAYGDARPRGNERQGRARPAESGTGFSIGGLDDQQDDSERAATAPQPLQRGSGNGSDTRGNDRASDSRGNDRGGWSAEPSPVAPTASSRAPAGGASGAAPVRVAALTTPQAQTLFDQGYTAFTQRNYRAAADSFEQFIQRYPTDPLAGSAQFWLGEAAFTGGDFRKAADLFLKTTSNYPNDEKAAESMLKLGISLKRLGENEAACSTFAELGRRYPNATTFQQRADTEKRRSNC